MKSEQQLCGFLCSQQKTNCGNGKVSPRDGFSLISSPYEVSTGIWQVLYEADNSHWRFLLSWNILSAIVHQNERCALLDDLCHCVIKLIISLNSLVVLAVFSKNLSVPVFLWLVGLWEEKKVAYQWYIDRTLLCPSFLCSSFVVQDGTIMKAQIGPNVAESCALYFSLVYKALWVTSVWPLCFISSSQSQRTAGVPQGCVLSPSCFPASPWLPSWGPNEVWTAFVLYSLVAVAAQLGFKPACPGCVLHTPSPWKHSWGGMQPPIPPLPEHHSLSLHKS